MIDKMKKHLGTDGKDRGIGKKVVAVLFFGAIILVFVFMGFSPDQLGGGSSSGVVAQVNDTSITSVQLRDMVRRMEQRFGGAANAALRGFIENQALESLIDREVLFQNSQDAGVLVSSGAVRDVIVNIPAFQEDGRFKRSFYQNYLTGSRQSAAKFEKEIRKDLSTQNLRETLVMALAPTKTQVMKEQKLSDETRNVEFVQFTKEDLVKKISSKEKVTRLSADLEGKAKEYYEANKVEYSLPEKVRARHILIKADSADAKQLSLAKEKADQIYKRTQKEDFAKLASELSEDTGSKVKGGDLGYFAKGQMVKPFEEKAFAMKAGEVSEPVKSSFGFHIIKVLDRQEKGFKDFSQVKSEIAARIQAREKVDSLVSDFEADLKEKKFSQLEKTLKKYDLNWQETGEVSIFAPSIPKIGKNEEVAKTIFALSAAKEEYAGRTYLVDGKTYILKTKVAAQIDKSKDSQNETSDDETREELLRDKEFAVLQGLRDQWKEIAHVQKNQLQRN